MLGVRQGHRGQHLGDSAVKSGTALVGLLAVASLLIAHPARARDIGELGSMSESQNDPGPGQLDAVSHDRMAPDMGDMHEMSGMHDMHMSHDMGNMALHMVWSDSRPKSADDDERARRLVETLKTALAKYQDYRVAEADGFKPFHPEFKQPMVHFTKT